jgi:NAD-dependent deacetylase
MKAIKPIHLTGADRVFVLTGAGVSAESGLATFRGAGGLWEGRRVEDVATPEAWHRDPECVWRFYSERRTNAAKAQPNAAHRALAALERSLAPGRFFLCTQNVDDLHERAGSRNLAHMHGELFRSRCESCDNLPFTDRQLYPSAAEHRFCPCGGRLRPDIVWFGEVPLHMERIHGELQRCTVMLVVGTSGVVQPAASFVHWANSPLKLHPARVYYVGPETPANAGAFDRHFQGSAGELLPRLFPPPEIEGNADDDDSD